MNIKKLKKWTIKYENHFLDSYKISLKAKAILTIMLNQLEDNWEGDLLEFILAGSKEGKTSIQSGLKELKNNKLLIPNSTKN